MGNHRSFRDEQELLLMPVYVKDRGVLPVAAVYGANASGKSNLLDGLKFMADAVRDSFAQWRPGGGVPRRPFKLDPTTRDRPSVFVVDLVLGGVRYTYGFEVDDRHVLAEWLYSYPEKRKRVLFDRSGDSVKFGTTVADVGAKVEVLESLLRSDSLFLSLAGRSNLAVLQPVYRWFVDQLVFRLSDDDSANLEARIADFMLANPGLRDRVVGLLGAADLGITDIAVVVDPATDDGVEIRAAEDVVVKARASLRLAEADLEEVEAEMKRIGKGSGLAARRRMLRGRVDAAARDYGEAHGNIRRTLAAADRARREIQLAHGVIGEPFRLDDESAGTLSWLSLLPTVLTVLDEGGVLVIDEIDASLHSLLSARLVALFNDREVNAAGGQLIFTTHDATLLNPPLADEVLDRDEVWFVEKSPAGVSTLYPLTDFKPRREDNLERRYLAGQYGGVPNVYGELFAEAVRGGGIDGEA